MTPEIRSDPVAESRLVLVRHGESAAQEGGYVSGHATCTGLSDRGRRQAARLRDRLARTGELDAPDALYTSILPRAIETATIIAPALGAAPEPVAECDFCEIHAGEAEGQTWEQLREHYPDEGDWADPYVRRFPGGESWAEFYTRAGARLRRLGREHPGQRVLVVCHGGIIGASFAALGDLPIRATDSLTHEAANTSITEWRGAGDTWRLVRYNDAAHLA
jgi:2,3-bisphosphoglycerate-dependent phosphoglycerate mutase